jgi:hypothetical protein
MFENEVLVFWLIHLVIGLLVPALAYYGCCRADEPEPHEML